MLRHVLKNWRLITFANGLELSVHALGPVMAIGNLILSGDSQTLLFWLLIWAAAIVHTLGHFIVAKLLGEPVELIRLYPVFSIFRLGIPAASIRNDILITAAGPLANLALAAVLWKASAEPQPWQQELVRNNLIYGIITLLPLYPMDGSRLLRLIFNALFGFDRSIEYSNFIGQAVTAGAVIWCFYNGHTLYGFIGVFVYVLSKLAPMLQRLTLAVNKREMISENEYDSTGNEMVVMIENKNGVWEQAVYTPGQGSPEPKLFF